MNTIIPNSNPSIIAGHVFEDEQTGEFQSVSFSTVIALLFEHGDDDENMELAGVFTPDTPMCIYTKQDTYMLLDAEFELAYDGIGDQHKHAGEILVQWRQELHERTGAKKNR